MAKVLPFGTFGLMEAANNRINGEMAGLLVGTMSTVTIEQVSDLAQRLSKSVAYRRAKSWVTVYPSDWLDLYKRYNPFTKDLASDKFMDLFYETEHNMPCLLFINANAVEANDESAIIVTDGVSYYAEYNIRTGSFVEGTP